MSRRAATRDAWLFLPPEVERLVPGLLQDMGAAPESAEAAAIDRLIARGDAPSWLAHLRVLSDLLASAVAEHGPTRSARTLALVLRDQYVLALGIREPDRNDREQLARLEALLHDRFGVLVRGATPRTGAHDR